MRIPTALSKFLLLAFVALFARVALPASPDDLLEPDKAFRFSARAIDPATVEVHYDIAKGYYLYRERFQFTADPAAIRLGTAQFPKGEVHVDAFFGRTETYRGELRILLPVEGEAKRMRLKVTSQGCADAGVCYTPQDQFADIRFDAPVSGPYSRVPGGSPLEGTSSAQSSHPSLFSSDTDIAAMFESGSFRLVLATFFGFGILLAFTPCVLPMIPILSGIIAGEGRNVGKLHAFILSIAYVLGMSLTYALAGVAAGYSGTLIAAALQNRWVLTAFALVFVWLALAMFEFHDIQIPSFIHHRLSRAHHRLAGGQIASVAAMGMLSAVIVSPCVAAPLAGALLYISQTGNVVLGGSSLFVMAVGMGVPLVVVGVSEGALLPKSGAWMNSVKKFFGVLLLGVAIWIISPVLPDVLVMLLWAALLIVSAMFLRAIDSLPHDAPGYSRLWKGIGLIALVAGIGLVVGALAGSRDPLQPLAGLRTSAAGASSPARFEGIRTVAELESRLKTAGRPVMLDFYADWCVSCKEMERYTFSDPQVQARFASMLLLRADVTANNEEDKALLKRFRLFGPPGIIFFDKDGGEIEGLRVIGYQSSERFLKTLERAGSL